MHAEFPYLHKGKEPHVKLKIMFTSSAPNEAFTFEADFRDHQDLLLLAMQVDCQPLISSTLESDSSLSTFCRYVLSASLSYL